MDENTDEVDMNTWIAIAANVCDIDDLYVDMDDALEILKYDVRDESVFTPYIDPDTDESTWSFKK